jgi:hypothetical protein
LTTDRSPPLVAHRSANPPPTGRRWHECLVFSFVPSYGFPSQRFGPQFVCRGSNR